MTEHLHTNKGTLNTRKGNAAENQGQVRQQDTGKLHEGNRGDKGTARQDFEIKQDTQDMTC